jgi:hypothetical protein
MDKGCKGEKFIQKINLSENLSGRDYMGDVIIDEKVILKCVLRK